MQPREILANHPQKSPPRWMELRLYDDYGWQRPINFGCGRIIRQPAIKNDSGAILSSGFAPTPV
jgi:hypothetical protein